MAVRTSARLRDTITAVAVVCVIAATLLTNRWIALDGFFRVWDGLLLLAGIAVLAIIPARRFGDVRSWLRIARPLLVLIAVDAVVRIVSAFIAAGQLSAAGLDAGPTYRWLLFSLLPFGAMLAALIIGFVARIRWKGVVAVVVGAVVASNVVMSLVQWAADSGVSQAAASLVTGFNELTGARPDLGFKGWDPYLRAVGFHIDPNFMATTGAIALAWSLTTKRHPRSRWWIAAGSIVMIALSRSRTGAIAAIAVIFAVFLFESIRAIREAKRAGGKPAPLRLALPLLPFLALIPLAWVSRFDEALLSLRASSFAEAMDLFTNGRYWRWERGFEAWLQKPWGWFTPPDVVTQTPLHSEFLDRLVWGGPIMLVAFVVVLWWLAFRFRPAGAPFFGVAVALVWGLTATMLPTVQMPGLANLVFFLVGTLIVDDLLEAQKPQGKKAR